MFRDECSQEWAINTTSVSVQAAAKPACLAKEKPQNDVVLFRDLCTNEWAMNPPPSGTRAQTTGQGQSNQRRAAANEEAHLDPDIRSGSSCFSLRYAEATGSKFHVRLSAA
jgi:hypothetical protein